MCVFNIIPWYGNYNHYYATSGMQIGYNLS